MMEMHKEQNRYSEQSRFRQVIELARRPVNMMLVGILGSLAMGTGSVDGVLPKSIATAQGQQSTEEVQPEWADQSEYPILRNNIPRIGKNIIATEYACTPDRTIFPNFQCPEKYMSRPGVALFEYNANGFDEGVRRTSQAMIFIPRNRIRQFENGQPNKSLPLAILLHGRGVINIPDNIDTGFWGLSMYPGAPRERVDQYIERLDWAANHFGIAIVAPKGQGRIWDTRSWGYPDHIRNMSQMPGIVKQTFPFLNIDDDRVYAFGSSMGGHEAMQLSVMYSHLFAGIFSGDGVSNWVKRYDEIKNGVERSGKGSGWSLSFDPEVRDELIRSVEEETGGTPEAVRIEYLRRSAQYWIARRGRLFCETKAFIGASKRDSVVPVRQSEGYVYSWAKKCGPKKVKANLRFRYSKGGHGSFFNLSTGYRLPLNYFRRGGEGRDWIKRSPAQRRVANIIANQ